MLNESGELSLKSCQEPGSGRRGAEASKVKVEIECGRPYVQPQQSEAEKDVDCLELEVILGYIVSTRPAWAT